MVRWVVRGHRGSRDYITIQVVISARNLIAAAVKAQEDHGITAESVRRA